jgi:hypothetical protein
MTLIIKTKKKGADRIERALQSKKSQAKKEQSFSGNHPAY